MKRVLIIDSNNLLYRLWFINNGKKFTNSSGKDVTSILLFLRALRSYVDQFNPEEIYCTWDKKLEHPSSNFRKEMNNVDYKGQRTHDNFEEIHKNDDVIVKLTQYLGVKHIYPRVMEADDVIAWLCLSDKLVNCEITIVSGDYDLWQLVSKRITVYNPIKKISITPNNFEQLATVPQEHYIKFKSIKGDPSDNIYGIEGYGSVKSKKMCLGWEYYNKLLTPEQLLIIENNIKLIDLSYGYKVHPEEVPCYEQQYKNLLSSSTNFDKFKKECEVLELPSITNRMSEWIASFSKQNFKQNINDLVKKLNLQF